jgi:hypothetical protein
LKLELVIYSICNFGSAPTSPRPNKAKLMNREPQRYHQQEDETSLNFVAHRTFASTAAVYSPACGRADGTFCRASRVRGLLSTGPPPPNFTLYFPHTSIIILPLNKCNSRKRGDGRETMVRTQCMYSTVKVKGVACFLSVLPRFDKRGKRNHPGHITWLPVTLHLSRSSSEISKSTVRTKNEGNKSCVNVS